MDSCHGFWCVGSLQLLATTLAALPGGNIAWWQKEIARIKLRHDLYEKRYAVYKAARDFLAEASTRAIASEQSQQNLLQAHADSKFLFDAEVSAYLLVLWEKSSEKWVYKSEPGDVLYPPDPAVDDHKSRFLLACAFIQEQYQVLDGIFTHRLNIPEPEGMFSWAAKMIYRGAAHIVRLVYCARCLLISAQATLGLLLMGRT
jgi:hypothetical protein